MYDYPEELGKLKPDFLWNMVNINVSAVTMMTRMLVNDMKKRGRGAIVNVSSGSELQPLPYAAVYGACKVSFTRAINLWHRHLKDIMWNAFQIDVVSWWKRKKYVNISALWLNFHVHYAICPVPY